MVSGEAEKAPLAALYWILLSVANRALSLAISAVFSTFAYASNCRHLPILVAFKGQEKGKVTKSRFLARSATLDISHVQASGFRL
jgi:hypothetical protein